MLKRLEITLVGDVQGIAFRAYIKRTAELFCVTGTVQNMQNGDVHIVAEGDDSILEGFLSEIENYDLANINRTVALWTNPSREFDSFKIVSLLRKI